MTKQTDRARNGRALGSLPLSQAVRRTPELTVANARRIQAHLGALWEVPLQEVSLARLDEALHAAYRQGRDGEGAIGLQPISLKRTEADVYHLYRCADLDLRRDIPVREFSFIAPAACVRPVLRAEWALFDKTLARRDAALSADLKADVEMADATTVCCLLMRHHAMRAGLIGQLRWGDIDLKANRYVLRGQELVLDPGVKKKLAVWRKDARTLGHGVGRADPVVPDAPGARILPTRSYLDWLYSTFRSRYGVRVSDMALRDTAILELFGRNRKITFIARITGRRADHTRLRYEFRRRYGAWVAPTQVRVADPELAREIQAEREALYEDGVY